MAKLKHGDSKFFLKMMGSSLNNFGVTTQHRTTKSSDFSVDAIVANPPDMIPSFGKLAEFCWRNREGLETQITTKLSSRAPNDEVRLLRVLEVAGSTWPGTYMLKKLCASNPEIDEDACRLFSHYLAHVRRANFEDLANPMVLDCVRRYIKCIERIGPIMVMSQLEGYHLTELVKYARTILPTITPTQDGPLLYLASIGDRVVWVPIRDRMQYSPELCMEYPQRNIDALNNLLDQQDEELCREMAIAIEDFVTLQFLDSDTPYDSLLCVEYLKIVDKLKQKNFNRLMEKVARSKLDIRIRNAASLALGGVSLTDNLPFLYEGLLAFTFPWQSN